jgi:hypothetical protein
MVSLRKFPYPFKCALSICSDADAVRSYEEFKILHDKLNTNRSIDGLGLPISDSLFLRSKSRLSFIDVNGDIDERIRGLTVCGIIDAIHSYSELSEGPSDADDLKQALNILSNHRIKIPIWTNHSQSDFNLITGYGDMPDRKYYHAKTLADYGVKYIWVGALTPIWGQSTKISISQLVDILKNRNPDFLNIRTLCFFLAKYFLSLFKQKYKIFKNNDLAIPVTLRDGTKFFEFVRYGEGMGKYDRMEHLKRMLTTDNLNKLIKREAYTIIYTHFGKRNNDIFNNMEDIFSPLLRKKEDIFITTTSNILKYYVTFKYLKWQYDKKKNSVMINRIEDPVSGYKIPSLQDIEGITFVSKVTDLNFYINDEEVKPENVIDVDTAYYRFPMSTVQYPAS